MLSTDDSLLKEVIKKKDTYQIQIIYTKIDRDVQNAPKLITYSFNTSRNRYYYPASLVKLPLILSSLDVLNETKTPKNLGNARMISKGYGCVSNQSKDKSSFSGYPYLYHYIKKILLVSDNDAYNRLYDFVGYDRIHSKLNEKGFDDIRIIQRFAKCSPTDNQINPAIHFYTEQGKLLHQLPLRKAQKTLTNPLPNTTIGVQFKTNSGELLPPLNCSLSNHLPFEDIHKLVTTCIFPKHVTLKKRFNVTDAQYHFIRHYMSSTPSENDYPFYSKEEGYFDTYKKYLVFGRNKNIILDGSIRSYNIVGWAYGYLADCAYIVDFNTNTEFFLSALIYTNANGVINDGVYQYNPIAFPFMEKLGKMILDYERTRKKNFIPDLTEFKRK